MAGRLTGRESLPLDTGVGTPGMNDVPLVTYLTAFCFDSAAMEVGLGLAVQDRWSTDWPRKVFEGIVCTRKPCRRSLHPSDIALVPIYYEEGVRSEGSREIIAQSPYDYVTGSL